MLLSTLPWRRDSGYTHFAEIHKAADCFYIIFGRKHLSQPANHHLLLSTVGGARCRKQMRHSIILGQNLVWFLWEGENCSWTTANFFSGAGGYEQVYMHA